MSSLLLCVSELHGAGSVCVAEGGGGAWVSRGGLYVCMCGRVCGCVCVLCSVQCYV